MAAPYASVVLVEPSLAHLGRPFVYAVPEGMRVAPGAVVRVPFRGRRRIGVVTGHRAEADISPVFPIAAVLPEGLGADLLSMCRWIAEQYLSTPGEALAAALPQRVAGEEERAFAPAPPVRARSLAWTARYRGGAALARALARGGGAFLWRPLANERRGAAISSMAAAAAARGKGALVLLPEVRFPGGTAAALEESFGPGLAWLGSDRPARARYRAWLELRRGAARVAAGGRSAVFAPVPDLGLVVVDDEGHHTYKERRSPRFHARAVAAERARSAGATLVLVGMPPSIEARAAVERGTLSGVVPSRADELRRRPPVTVLDRNRSAERHVPSTALLQMARRALGGGRRVVLLVHRSGDEARRIADRAVSMLPARAPARLDATVGARAVARAMRSADLIVATPVVAKDVEPERVGLVAILEADAALSSPGFRAAEEAFGTWWHVGRWAGSVALETAQPAHPAVRALARWDPDILWRAEAARRSELGYPPFGSLVRLEMPAARAGAVANMLDGIGTEILGPVVEGETAVILLRARERRELITALAPIVPALREEEVRIDVDPREVLPS